MSRKQTAIVFGAGRGLGRQISIDLAKKGQNLILVDIANDMAGCNYAMATAEQLSSTVDLARKEGGIVEKFHCDIRSLNELESLSESLSKRVRQIDSVINCVGIVGPSGKAVDQIHEEDWKLIHDVNVNGAFNVIKTMTPLIKSSQNAAILNISSTAGLVAYHQFAAYVSSKHALIGLTKAAALDLMPHGIRVNALCPGSVKETTFTEGVMLKEIAAMLNVQDNHEEFFRKAYPNNELVDPQVVSLAACWLVNEEAKGLTGLALPVDNGFAIK